MIAKPLLLANFSVPFCNVCLLELFDGILPLPVNLNLSLPTKLETLNSLEATFLEPLLFVLYPDRDKPLFEILASLILCFPATKPYTVPCLLCVGDEIVYALPAVIVLLLLLKSFES